jgi:hypothetical protein
VEGNQPGLHDALIRLCAARAAFDRHEAVDRHRHGRQEQRRIEVFDPTPVGAWSRRGGR